MNAINLGWKMKFIESSRKKRVVIFLANEIAKAFRGNCELFLEQALLKLLKLQRFEVQYIAYCELKLCYASVSEPGQRELKKYEDDPKNKRIVEKAKQEYVFSPCPEKDYN